MFFTPKYVGVDIGSSAVRIVEARKRGAIAELQDYIIAPLPVGAVANGNVLNVDAVALAIQEAMRKSKISGRNVVLSVDSQNVVIRHVKFPKMKEEELAEALKWELDQYIPMPAADAVADFEIVGEEEEDGVIQMDIMLVVAAKKVLQGYVEAVQKAGFKPLAVDIEPLALVRVLNLKGVNTGGDDLAKHLSHGAVALLDMGAGSTKLTFFRQGKIMLNRIINVGGYDLTKAVAARLRVTLEQAERVKREYGLTGLDKSMNSYSEVAAALEKDIGEQERQDGQERLPLSAYEQEVAEELKPKIDEIIAELKRSIDFYKLQYRHEFINRIILVGGASLLKGLPQYLEAQTGIKTVLFNPLDVVHYKTRSRRDNIDCIAPTLTNAIGLAIREVKGR
ncbi:type IV pilus assembly protein PilM [Thermincola ferriacetica]